MTDLRTTLSALTTRSGLGLLGACSIGACLISGLAACSSDVSEPPAADETASPLPDAYWLAADPEDPQSVREARELAGGAEELTVVGRVSGYMDTRAQFKLTDLSFRPCNEREGDGCKTPWDYCCEAPDELARGTLVVECRAGEALLEASPRGFHGLDHLREVVVTGRPETDETGNVILVASGIHVRP